MASTSLNIHNLRAKVYTYLMRIERGHRHIRPVHVKLVDLGLHHTARYLYAHDNDTDRPEEALIGHLGRGPEMDLVWTMLCRCTEALRSGKRFNVVRAKLERGEFDQP